MKQDGLQFPEAANVLAQRYGIDIPKEERSVYQKKRASEREHLLAVNRQARDFFHKCLVESPSGQPGRDYLANRGITKEVIDSFQLGYVPTGWDNALKHFARKRVSSQLLEKAGLVVPKKNQKGYYDRFRNRIIFPIFDVSNQVVGFGGRVLDDALPKYLNSPETGVYNKSRSLYGLNRAKRACRKSGKVLIVEGYFDLISLHLNGIENVVATLGTALTPEHIRVLKGFAEQAILIFDSDEAGIKAAQRSTGLFGREYIEARIVVLPTGYDPDTYVHEYGAKGFKQVARRSVGVMDFLMQIAEQRHGRSIEGKIRIVEDMLAPLAAIEDNVSRSLHTKQLAERIGIEETAIVEKIRQLLERQSAQQARRAAAVSRTEQAKGATVDASREDVHEGLGGDTRRIERKIIAMMLQFPAILEEIIEKKVLKYFSDRRLQAIGETILSYDKYRITDVDDIRMNIKDPKAKDLVVALSIQEDPWDLEGGRRLITQFLASCAKQQNNLLNKIREAEESNNLELLLELLKQKQNQARNRQESNLTSVGG
jgi:DNA primase